MPTSTPPCVAVRPLARIERCGFAVIAAFVAYGLASLPALSAGTAYNVDTGEVGDPGNCKVEAWTSWARNSDGLATAIPSCIVETFTPTELSLQTLRARSDGDWSTSITPLAKFKLIPSAIGSVGIAFASGFNYSLTTQEATSVVAYVPGTLRLSEVVRINLNAGWLQDRTVDQHYATYGLGLDWKFADTLTLTLETFGQTTFSQSGGSEPSSVVRPRFQAGVRYRPSDPFSVDFIYGRNINGENSDWFTVSTAIRFPPK